MKLIYFISDLLKRILYLARNNHCIMKITQYMLPLTLLVWLKLWTGIFLIKEQFLSKNFIAL